MIVPNLLQQQGVDQFRGAETDTISMKVEGILPFHDCSWRNDRSSPIVFDVYVERITAVGSPTKTSCGSPQGRWVTPQALRQPTAATALRRRGPAWWLIARAIQDRPDRS